MGPIDISNLLSEFSSLPRAFTTDEVGDAVSTAADGRKLTDALRDDKRFLALSVSSMQDVKPIANTRGYSEEYWISRQALWRWFISFIIRLHEASITEMSANRLAESVSRIRVWGQWTRPPLGALDLGRQFGLIAPSRKTDQFVIPLSYLLSRIPQTKRAIAISQLTALGDEANPERMIQEPIQHWVALGLSHFDKRITSVVERREALLGGDRETLDAIGVDLGLTRERVRQVQAKFWTKLSRLPHLQIPFIKALIFQVMRSGGRLIFDSDATLIRFAAKCSELPFFQLPHNGHLVLGAVPSELDVPLSFLAQGNQVQLLPQMPNSSPGAGFPFSEMDFNSFVTGAENLTPKSQKKVTRVRQALREIGKPAHFTEVTEKYNELFPYDPSGERSIHAILSREVHGIVWVGARGTFALREWGYERPTQPLFDTVAQIVETLYASTGKPVSFKTVSAEIGRYRKIVNPSSLALAAYCNPRLSYTGDAFFPSDASEQDSTDRDYSRDELDKILSQFRSRSISATVPHSKKPAGRSIDKKKRSRRRRS